MCGDTMRNTASELVRAVNMLDEIPLMCSYEGYRRVKYRTGKCKTGRGIAANPVPTRLSITQLQNLKVKVVAN